MAVNTVRLVARWSLVHRESECLPVLSRCLPRVSGRPPSRTFASRSGHGCPAGYLSVRPRYFGINSFLLADLEPPHDERLQLWDGSTQLEVVGKIVNVGQRCRKDITPGLAVVFTTTDSPYKLVNVQSDAVCCVPEVKAEYISLLSSGLTAAIALDKVSSMAGNDVVLVTDAANNIGQMALQLARLQGCHVIGTCHTADEELFLQTLRCNRIVNVTREDIRDVLRQEYHNSPDIVFDAEGLLSDAVKKCRFVSMAGAYSGGDEVKNARSDTCFRLGRLGHHTQQGYVSKLVALYEEGLITSGMAWSLHSGILEGIEGLYTVDGVGKAVVSA